MNHRTAISVAGTLIASSSIALAAAAPAPAPPPPLPQRDPDSVSGNLLVNTPASVTVDAAGKPASALRSVSLFAIAPMEPRTYREHDLVQIIVRETSQAKSSQDLNAKKDAKLTAKVPKWPAIQLEDILNLQMYGGRNTNMPEAEVAATKDFKSSGDYTRKDDLSARVTAEVIEVLPNGNLVLEARTCIKMDEEEKSMRVTGICRPEDITPANTVLSNQIHDLNIHEEHEGELPRNASKGIIAKVLDMIFAF
jgi:flagellar L-ring protein FlgH